MFKIAIFRYHQLKLATQELKQMDNQVLASDIRVKIAEQDLENHNKNIEQTNELDEFYKNKFTNLGLYNYLSTSMSRLYREAYNLAYDMALKAEQAYIFEQDNDAGPFIAHDNWQFDRAGLLAGERLVLQLQRMEKTYMDNNKRENEITQSFSLAILNPQALTELKEKGTCNFDIPEIMFDLFYPGQYKRLIKSVRITIPCVTGPYTNISAKLSLLNYSVREEPNLDIPISQFGNTRISTTSISTSSAQNDTGTFEFSFRDERYLPFEGAGAISEWELKLPSVIRSFDYNTISDVIIHVSYTAKEGGGFRDTVEGKIHDILNDFALSNGLYHLVSLKHDFASAFYKLLNPAVEGGKQVTEFVIGKNYFPYFLSKEELALSSSTTIYLKSKGKDHVNTDNLTLKINGATINSGSWTSFTETLKDSVLTLTGKPDKTWTIDAGVDGFDKGELDDILILMQYKIQ
jgi:Tc toxin complex TcA C-terminal TcB-binding domain